MSMISVLFLYFFCVEPGGIYLLEIDKHQSVFMEQNGESVQIHAYDSNGKDFSIIGIDLNATERVTYIVKDGYNGKTEEKAIYICESKFPEEHIKIRRRKRKGRVEVLDLERIKMEKDFIRKVLSENTPEKLWDGRFIIPVEGKITGEFGARRFINGFERAPHAGIDIRAKRGTPVVASNSGRVVLARILTLEGNTVILYHGFGIFTMYLHLDKIYVKEGEVVKKGEIIGTVGRTGRSTAPHLHFASKIVGARVDPRILFNTNFP